MKTADYPYKLQDNEKSRSSPDHSLDDKVLWNSIRYGNNLAFTTLYKKYVNQLFNYGMHISFDRELVLDCLQELFAGIWLRREGVVELNHVNYYLFKSFRNLVIQKLNKKRKTIFGFDFSKTIKEFDPSWEENLISDQAKDQKLKQLKSAINCLTVRQREAILLKYFNELSYQQTSSIMGISLESVHNLISKSIQALRKQMGPFSLFLLLYLG